MDNIFVESIKSSKKKQDKKCNIFNYYLLNFNQFTLHVYCIKIFEEVVCIQAYRFI